jgi:hypothetical protein
MYKKAGKLAHLGEPINLVGPVRSPKQKPKKRVLPFTVLRLGGGEDDARSPAHIAACS